MDICASGSSLLAHEANVEVTVVQDSYQRISAVTVKATVGVAGMPEKNIGCSMEVGLSTPCPNVQLLFQDDININVVTGFFSMRFQLHTYDEDQGSKNMVAGENQTNLEWLSKAVV